MPTDFIEVTTTIPSQKDAERLAQAVVTARLAACAQVLGPIRSVFWWQGAVETADEWLCLIKTDARRFDELQQCIRQNHAYETPQITAVPISAGSDAYLRWLHEELRG